MATSRNRTFAKLATNVNTDGDVTTTGLAPAITADIAAAGTAVYDSASLLPISGNTAGDTAFVKSTSRLYIHSGVGWYNVAVINNTPTVQSITDSDGGTTPFALATDGTPTTITIIAQDSDGDPLTYNYSADSGFAGLATLSQDANVFTITPLSEDSATTESGTITFSVTDGINTATPGAQTFTLTFAQGIADITSTSNAAMTNITTITQTTRSAFTYGNYLWVGTQPNFGVLDVTGAPLDPPMVSYDPLPTAIGGTWNDTTTLTGWAIDKTRGVIWNSRIGYPIRSINLNGSTGTWSVNPGFLTGVAGYGQAIIPSPDGTKLYVSYTNVGSLSGIKSYDVSDLNSTPVALYSASLSSTFRYCGFNDIWWNADGTILYVFDEYLVNSSGTNLRPSSSSTGQGKLHMFSVNQSTGQLSVIQSITIEASPVVYGVYGLNGCVASDIDATYDYLYSSPQEVDTLFITRVSKSNPTSYTRFTYSFGTIGDTGYMHYKEGILYIHSDSGLIMLDVASNPTAPAAHYTSPAGGSNWQYTKNDTFKAGKYYAVSFTISNSRVVY